MRRVGRVLLQVLGLFVVLEPIWMLLPFAGFIYGSVFHLQALSRNPTTAPLTHFVFPVLTLGWVGPALALAGLLVFAVGATQVYAAKLRRTGLVTGGLYRFVRHPQYTALTLLGVGLLLAWGRAVAYIAFFLMMFLYYHLARSEERRCLALFGDDYARYRDRTSFAIPGDRALAARLPRLGLPASVRVVGSLVLTVGLCLGSMALVTAVKHARRTVPYLTAVLELGEAEAREPAPEIRGSEAAGVPFVASGRVAVVRGPYRNAAVPGFAEQVLTRLGSSAKLEKHLSFLREPGGDSAIVFSIPFDPQETPGRPPESEGRGPPPDAAGPDRVRLLVFRCRPTPGASLDDALAERSKRELVAAWFVPVDLGRPEGEDIVEGEVFRPGPGFPAEERFAFLVTETASRAGPAAPVVVPGQARTARLVLVKAPILRTRLDPEFAQEILDRLLVSDRFRARLDRTGVGGDLVAVAFPRPGPNWYREHHGKPQISVFVMLVRPSDEGVPVERMFPSDSRTLVGAFTAELDFAAGPGEDGVRDVVTIGPRRDLEERWEFFLSGL